MKGYPVIVNGLDHILDADKKHQSLQVTVVDNDAEINYGQWFVENYPPSEGAVVHKITRSGRMAVNFVLTQMLAEEANEQCWQLERVENGGW